MSDSAVCLNVRFGVLDSAFDGVGSRCVGSRVNCVDCLIVHFGVLDSAFDYVGCACDCIDSAFDCFGPYV